MYNTSFDEKTPAGLEPATHPARGCTSPPSLPQKSWTSRNIRSCAALAIITFNSIVALGLWQRSRPRTPDGPARLLHLVQTAVGALVTLELNVQLLRWSRYRPVPAVSDDGALPTVTVVIPAYNESGFVRSSVRSALASDYPPDKLELVVVDDGSADDTWSHVVAATTATPSAARRCRAVRHPANRGKRDAIRTGFLLARGEVLVTLDSDSVLERGALRALVAPLVACPSVGGVAGHLSVLNVGGGVVASSSFRATLVPRIVDVLFDWAGNVPRTAQHAAGFVTILPGALSAFRAAAVAPHVDGLCASTFLGDRLRHGEDVELTLRVLRDGWRTAYQSSAVVHTVAPETAKRVMLMFTRWERSSYVCLSLGYFHLCLREAGRWLFGRRGPACTAGGTMKEKLDEADEAGWRPFRAPSLYPALNMVGYVLGKPLLIVCVLLQVKTLLLAPQYLLVLVGMSAVSSAWSALFFIADVWDEEPDAAGGLEADMGGTVVHTPASRLVWKIPYAVLAAWFQIFYLSWSSVFGLLTIRSQSWMTR